MEKTKEKFYTKEFYESLQKEHDACGIGTIVNIDGHKDYRVLDDALSIVEKLEHRAGKDATGKVGDGVGILTQVSHTFFSKAAKEAGITLGGERDYGVGMFFLPQDTLKRTFAMRMLEVITQKEGLNFLGWRAVPVHPEILGAPARDCMPYISQCFIERPKDCPKGIDFDRRLYVVRREFEQSSEDTYICSLSSRTIVYKGMFLVMQLRKFYDDLQDPDFQTAIAIVHSRFSTNTTPSWNRAHPYRMIAHNGEINTIRGNIDRMLAREETMFSPIMESDIDKIFPVVNTAGSDSAMLDNTLEFLYMNGMDLPLAMMVTIPEPWKHNGFMSEDRKDFYHYYATMMEPWDGPAAILFSDGDLVGATLDRNGLRPSRYYITDDNRLILASEVGVLDIAPEHVLTKGRLEPGKILLVDTVQKRIISDAECKNYYSHRQPYGEWLDSHLLHLENLAIPNKKIPTHSQEDRDKLYKVFGYTNEDVNDEILPMALNGVEPTASMGHDVPLAVLSKQHQLLFNYFKQLFAQVTNPPIDSLREKIVTDTTVYIGSDGDLLNEKGNNCTVLEVNNPILTGVDIMKIKSLNQPGFHARTLSLLYYKNTSLAKALEQLNISVDRAETEGINIIILSDRGVDENHVPIPSLLAVSSVEQHLVRTKKRTKVSLILESGEPRDVHQVATLLGFGARAVNPYLAHECIAELIDMGNLDKDYHTAIEDYNKALLQGVVKIAAKMGISTIQSYQSARIFEAVGLSQEIIDRYFTGTVSRVGGIGIPEIEEGITFRHDHAFDPLGLGVDTTLDSVGFHNLRSGKDKEDHLYSPETIITLQQAVRTGSYEKFKEYTKLVDDPARPHTLRSLMDFAPKNAPIPLEEVEPVENILHRFKTGAMSFGSISQEAHETLALAMNRIGGKSNTGEGGEDPARYGTDRNSAIKQVASGRFGVTSAYLNSAVEIQIKMAQGAKPGEGGHLPGKKVYPWVAKIRYSTPGVALISPPPHHDIYSIEDLAQLIYDLKNANRGARISVKLVSESGVGTIACGVAKAGAQVILISGYDGGTGAAPTSSIHNAGLPWELGIAEAHQNLIANGLRGRVILETDGKLMSGRDVAIAALLGAEEYGFATAPLICMGCMMMRVCSKDTCPVGIATQNRLLRDRFAGKPEYVINFMTFIAQELREIMAKMGFSTLDEMIGRTDCLEVKKNPITKRASKVDLSRVLDPRFAHAAESHFEKEKVYDFHLEKTLDMSVLLPAFAPQFDKKPEDVKKKTVELKVSSTDRAFGTILGSDITRHFGEKLPEDTFEVIAHGGGGQSFGAFAPKGLTLRLYGDANDGFGKGLSGGKLIVAPEKGSKFVASKNIIIGNVALYGATSGRAYVCGIAGERFCVRNSGAIAVAEGCGDHGLEYMTGGRAVILGPTGKNFAAGMSGGIAYVLDEDHTLYRRMNKDMVSMQELSEKYDIQELKYILQDYEKETGSELAKKILANFADYIPSFKKILPNDYQKMLIAISKYEEQGISHDNAVLEAFEEVTA
ncbi:MAG: glutamate synthase large subunit [Lachnospiraceae bacterium]|jgi:glutamate synthase (ferredoxin)|nr:glutamate synthase large subunit [Lachnospiraceae bacterium]MCI1397204.1 glutamate synthase large subunit [Lachnospiraceae bacterium]MCI1423046.1 glutamate synthase large subunit [Lachnospiraceae bacterium]MCI1451845.1 glutamate synthase large subunit [Lachnospiraceae bacterium]